MKSFAQNNLGDILRAYRFLEQPDPRLLRPLAQLLGFAWIDQVEMMVDRTERVTPVEKVELPSEKPSQDTASVQISAARGAERNDAWIDSVIQMGGGLPEWYEDADPLPEEHIDSEKLPPEPASLFNPPWQRAILLAALVTPVPSRVIDTKALVERLARGELLREVPYWVRPSLQRGCQVLVDLNESMQPFAQDQEQLLGILSRLLSPERLDVVFCEDGPPGDDEAYAFPVPPCPVLALSDLGISKLGPRGRGHRPWLDFAKVLHTRGNPFTVFFPGPIRRIPASLRASATVVPWDRMARASRVRRREAIQHTLPR